MESSSIIGTTYVQETILKLARLDTLLAIAVSGLSNDVTYKAAGRHNNLYQDMFLLSFPWLKASW